MSLGVAYIKATLMNATERFPLVRRKLGQYQFRQKYTLGLYTSIYKDGSKLTGIPKQSQKGRTTETVTEIDVQASDNNLQVICQVEHPSSGSFLSTSHTMSVLFPPAKIEGRSIPPTVDEGGEVTFTCDAASSNPPVNITWRAGEVLLSGATQYHIDAEYGGQRTRSQLNLKAKPEFDTTPFICEASNGLPNSPKANISLNVNHAPIWIVKPPEFIDAKEGDDLVIVARASAKPGPIKYKWWKDGVRLLSQNSPDIQIQDGGGLRFHPVNRAYSSNFSVEVENPRGKIKSYFVLDVLYGPTNLQAPTKVMVNEDSMAVMECSAEGNPKPLITWAKQNRSKALVSGKGIARLFVDQTSPSHSGTYECIATNEIGTVKALPSRLIVKHAPIIMSSEGHSSEFHAHSGRNGRLNCLAKAAPKPTFVWRNPNDIIIQNTTKYSILGPQLVDGISIWQSTLIIFNVHQNDYMKYKCEIHNMLGVDKGSLVLSPPLIPEAPINLKVINVTDEGRVTLTWMLPGDLRYPKGKDRTKSVDSYIIRYWEDDQRKYKEREIPAPKSMMAVISNLAPDRSYYVTISARGEEGQSPFTRPALMVNMPGVMGKASSSNSNHHSATTTNIKGRNTGWRVPRLLLLITTLTGAALLALNIAIIACFVKRRKRERNISVSSSKTTSLGVYYAPQMSNSVEDLEAPGNTPLSPISATQCQLLSGNEEKRVYVDNQQQFGSSLLLQVDDQIRGSRRSSNLNMSPTTGNQFPCQLEAPRPSIPLDLLEGSNIPLNESPLAFNPPISSFASNSESSNFIINAASPQNSSRVRELTQNEDQMSLSSQSSSRTRSPKIAQSNDQETGHKSLSEKEVFDLESGLLKVKKTSLKKDKANNGRSKPGVVAHSPFERHQQPSATPLSHFDQDYGNEAAETHQNFQATQIGMRTLNPRRAKKDEPRFATLQKPKSSTKGSYSSSLNPDELAYATINIKTSPRHRQAKMKLNPEPKNSSPQNSTNSQADIFPYATSSSVVGYHEIPRYINLRTFRENTAILTPQSQHNEQAVNETQPTNSNDIGSINNINGITIPTQSSDPRTPTIEAIDHTNINMEERPTNLHSSVSDVTHSKMAPDFSEKENILVLKLTNSRPLNSGTNSIA